MWLLVDVLVHILYVWMIIKIHFFNRFNYRNFFWEYLLFTFIVDQKFFFASSIFKIACATTVHAYQIRCAYRRYFIPIDTFWKIFLQECNLMQNTAFSMHKKLLLLQRQKHWVCAQDIEKVIYKIISVQVLVGIPKILYYIKIIFETI